MLFCIALATAVNAVGWGLVQRRRVAGQRVAPALLAPALCLAILISIIATHWPLRVSYLLSRDAFDSLARKVRAGEPIATPLRVGSFTIREVGVSERGIVCLWTETDRGGNIGFVQCPRDFVPFDLWSSMLFDDGWQFIAQD